LLLSGDHKLAKELRNPGHDDLVDVIITYKTSPRTEHFTDLETRGKGHLKRLHGIIKGASARVRAKELARLAAGG
jgi:hypothetical protein